MRKEVVLSWIFVFLFCVVSVSAVDVYSNVTLGSVFVNGSMNVSSVVVNSSGVFVSGLSSAFRGNVLDVGVVSFDSLSAPFVNVYVNGVFVQSNSLSFSRSFLVGDLIVISDVVNPVPPSVSGGGGGGQIVYSNRSIVCVNGTLWDGFSCLKPSSVLNVSIVAPNSFIVSKTVDPVLVFNVSFLRNGSLFDPLVASAQLRFSNVWYNVPLTRVSKGVYVFNHSFANDSAGTVDLLVVGDDTFMSGMVTVVDVLPRPIDKVIDYSKSSKWTYIVIISLVLIVLVSIVYHIVGRKNNSERNV